MLRAVMRRMEQQDQRLMAAVKKRIDRYIKLADKAEIEKSRRWRNGDLDRGR